MTQEQKNRSKRLHRLLDRAKEINKWRVDALEHLLTEVGPKLHKIGNKGYTGCGFHYGKVQSFGRLVAELAISFQPSMNWLEKCEEEEHLWIVREVVYENLVKEINDIMDERITFLTNVMESTE